MVSLGYIEGVLQQRQVAADVLETVHVGMQGVTNLIQTLEAMHQYARVGTLLLEKQLLPPLTVIKDAVAIARMDLNYRMHKVELIVPDGLPCVMGDRQKLTQVLVNLVRNALQATAQWRRVAIGASRVNGHVVFSVEDEGPGVPHEMRETLFQPFATGKVDGMGMGLYMSKLIIDSHQGEIILLDRPEGGSRFEVRLAAVN
jgi:signal transduction histidine kinase